MKTSTKRRPLVAILANSGVDAGLTTQTVDDKYCRAVTDNVGASCIILPNAIDRGALEDILQHIDGLLLTGDAANIEPRHYGGEGGQETHGPFDPKRDQSAIELIKLAHERDIPLLGICRGMQEINVALGGTLRNDLYGNEELKDHCQRPSLGSPDERYAPIHFVDLAEQGLLATRMQRTCAKVNSLHEQAIDNLAKPLSVAATSSDGLIEAICDRKKSFFYGVQWHAEFAAKHDPVSQAVFSMFARSMTN